MKHKYGKVYVSTCTVCGAHADELPQECLGEPMTQEQKDSVKYRGWDLVNGHWVNVNRMNGS